MCVMFRWNVGIFLGAYPCGIVPLWDELFGSESISQVVKIVLNLRYFFINILV